MTKFPLAIMRRDVDNYTMYIFNKIAHLVTPYASSIILEYDVDLGYIIKITTPIPRVVAALLLDEGYQIYVGLRKNEVIVDLL